MKIVAIILALFCLTSCTQKPVTPQKPQGNFGPGWDDPRNH